MQVFDWNIHVPADLLEKAIASSPYGYVITDTGQTNNPVIFVHKSFQQITGYEAKEVLVRNCHFLLGKDTDQSSLNKICDAVKKGHRFTAVVRNYKKNDSLFYNELTIISTLKEFIVHVELDKKEFKDQILANIQHLVLPSLDKITLNESKEEYIKQHRKSLEK